LTTSPDDGYDQDVSKTWLHTWLMPLVRQTHPRREPLLDGLAGDILLGHSGR